MLCSQQRCLSCRSYALICSEQHRERNAGKKWSTGAMGYFSGRRINTDGTGGNVAVPFKRRAGETLHDQYGYDVEETEEMIDHLRKIVMEGNGVQELWDIFQDEESTLMEQVEMWQCLLNAELETHLPMLNGYSRMEYEKKTGTNAFSIMLFDENGLDKDIKRDTGLQKLPLKTQEMIYRAFFENIRWHLIR
jgi:hypothetical protein